MSFFISTNILHNHSIIFYHGHHNASATEEVGTLVDKFKGWDSTRPTDGAGGFAPETEAAGR
jgi:hypothetical protein